MSHFLRVIHGQKDETVSSILIDKIDRSQGNFERYAYKTKQKIYVPYWNPADVSVKGYIDLIPTDEVLLSWENGTIKGLYDGEYIDRALVTDTSIAKSVISGTSLAGLNVSLSGTTFASVDPDKTYVIVSNSAGTASQTIPSNLFSTFTTTSIIFPKALVTIGSVAAGFKVVVKANSKLSDQVTL